MKILLVEDDIDIAASIADYLEYQAMSVDFAYSVEQAKNLLSNTTFDLIIMDVNLPDGNGISLCRELKQEHKIKQPILFLTARGVLADKLKAFESGAVDYMVKPFSMQELLARIKALNAHINSQEQFEISLGPLSVCIQSGAVNYKLPHGSQHEIQQIQLHSIGLKLLIALMRSHPKPLSTDRLCAIIWQDEIPKSNPLKSHISQINSQFVRYSEQKIITSIRGIGYQLSVPDIEQAIVDQVSENKAGSND
ncbi:response regulator transcription factor [Colwellia sp. BRX10-3]|uniref:response regulator transcription factor n=1 Tax=Colwellia sp. BRX10-3 TaxID=2759844 RepID=UPI0015F47224|nr:response regulator transcription factor [Colwellia sp. BRX10-3]MBA6389512.1 response regulator transcription factor [Colwellia sp. BRX10-3]